MPLQKSSHQLQCCTLVPLRLDQYVEHLPILIDRTPEIHSLPAKRHEHLIQMPLRMGPRPRAAKPSSDLRPKPRHPPTDRLVRNLYAALGKQLLASRLGDERDRRREVRTAGTVRFFLGA